MGIDFAVLFQNAQVAGVPLLFFVMSMVELTKDFGVSGKVGLRIASTVIGLVLGVGYQVATAVPADFSGWFTAGIFGLLLGVGAFKLYDVGQSIAAK